MTSTKLSASAPLSHPILTTVESIRTTPTQRAAFCQAKIIHVLEGHVSIETLGGFATLDPGMTLCLGAGRWCRLLPHSRTRLWTAYLAVLGQHVGDSSVGRRPPTLVVSNVTEVEAFSWSTVMRGWLRLAV
mgnify:CR=1 FL=1